MESECKIASILLENGQIKWSVCLNAIGITIDFWFFAIALKIAIHPNWLKIAIDFATIILNVHMTSVL